MLDISVAVKAEGHAIIEVVLASLNDMMQFNFGAAELAAEAATTTAPNQCLCCNGFRKWHRPYRPTIPTARSTTTSAVNPNAFARSL
jgi:hypothetical protein